MASFNGMSLLVHVHFLAGTVYKSGTHGAILKLGSFWPRFMPLEREGELRKSYSRAHLISPIPLPFLAPERRLRELKPAEFHAACCGGDRQQNFFAKTGNAIWGKLSLQHVLLMSPTVCRPLYHLSFICVFQTGYLDHPAHRCITYVWFSPTGVFICYLYAVYCWPWTWGGGGVRRRRRRSWVYWWWSWRKRTKRNRRGSGSKHKAKNGLILLYFSILG